MTKETIEQVLKFRDERNWKQFHNPKDLAISICLEAAELLEVFQWSAEDVRCEEKKRQNQGRACGCIKLLHFDGGYLRTGYGRDHSGKGQEKRGKVSGGKSVRT